MRSQWNRPRLVRIADACLALVVSTGASTGCERRSEQGNAPREAGGPEAAEASRASRDHGTPRPASTASAPRPDRAVARAVTTLAAPPDMLAVPGGTFVMGTDAGGEGDERPAHRVTVRSFWLDRTEVTNTAYQACVRAKKCLKPSPRAWHRGPLLPVTGISWFDALTYCGWVGKRLPREAEFERAVRGDDGRRFPWGNAPPTPALTIALGQTAPSPVGSRPRGRGPYGHDDLAGNVWEWMEDLYDPHAYRRAGAARGEPGSCPEILATQEMLQRTRQQGFTGSNPIPTNCEHVLRGGAYNYDAEGLRATNRVHHPGSWRLKVAGFRCAKEMP